MREYLEIGCTPADEDCLQVGHPLARAECHVYKRQLEREFPGVEIKVRRNYHDFGTYYECAAYFDDEDKAATDLALEAECGAANWDAIAKQELKALNASSMVN